jgi:hypothetical protein
LPTRQPRNADSYGALGSQNSGRAANLTIVADILPSRQAGLG